MFLRNISKYMYRNILYHISEGSNSRYRANFLLLLSLLLLRDFSPRPNYTDRATAACRQSYCQLLRIEGVAWSVQWIPTAVISIF
jgi:hypothetical protein